MCRSSCVQNQGWSSPDLPESAFLELDKRHIRIVDSLATLRLVPSAASSAAVEAAPSGSGSRLAAVVGGMLPDGTPIALKGGLEKEVGLCLAVSTEAIPCAASLSYIPPKAETQVAAAQQAKGCLQP